MPEHIHRELFFRRFHSILAPLVVAGEESADEAAIRERSIELLFSKKDLKKPEYRFAFNRILMNADALGDLGRALLMTALTVRSEEVAGWHQEAKEKFDKDLPSRVISNLSCCWCGLQLLEKLCATYKFSWDEVFPIHLEPCAKYLEYGAHEYLLDGGTSNKSVVEQTFEVMSRMGLSEGIDYDFTDDMAGLYIKIAKIYDRYTGYRKEYAVIGEVLTYSQFRKQLMHSDIMIQSNVQHKFKGKKSSREITTALFLLRCLEVGLSLSDLDLLTIGMVLDIWTEKGNDGEKYKTQAEIREANQHDFDVF